MLLTSCNVFHFVKLPTLFSEKQADVSTLMPDNENQLPDIDPRISEVYEDVKVILQTYRSGKLPKAFKVSNNLMSFILRAGH